MFAQLGVWLTTFLSGYVAGVVGTVSTALIPIALIWLTVYVANYGYAVTRGEASDPFSTFAWKMVKMMFIMAFALSAGTFMSVIFSTADGLQDGMATIFLRGGEFSRSAPATVFGTLDAANDQANTMLASIWNDAGITRLDLVVASIMFSLGTVIFLVLGAFVALLSKVILAFTMAIGPIAILTLMFRVSAKFFDAWLSTVMSAVVLSWFVFFALGLSFYVVQQLLLGMGASHAFESSGSADDVSVMKAAATYLVFMLLLAILLYQSPHLASALTGGASIRTGGAVVAGYAVSRMIGGRNSSGGSGGGGAAGSGGGSLSRGAGASYFAGRAAAATGKAGAAVGAAGADAVSYGLAAFQRVARRGNRA